MIDQDKPLKFCDPKTGEVFEDIQQARRSYCEGKDCVVNCALMSNAIVCCQWVEDNPAEAARLMGYEAVEENSENLKIPRICEVLGVEVGERFSIDGYPTDYGPVQVCEDGKIRRVISEKEFPFANDGEVGRKIGSNALYYLLNHPDSIIRKPRFTEEEVEDAKALMRILDATGIERSVYGGNLCAVIGEIARVVINDDLFPSLLAGQSVTLSEICGC